jgi:hypothetical protein
LWSTELEAIEWHHILPDIEGITSIAVSRYRFSLRVRH